MKTAKNFGVVILLVLVTVLVFQNTESVETKFLFISYSMPRALLLFLTLVVGIILGLLLGAKLSRPNSRDDE